MNSEMLTLMNRNAELLSKLHQCERVLNKYSKVSSWEPVMPNSNLEPSIRDDSEVINGVKVGGKQAREYKYTKPEKLQ